MKAQTKSEHLALRIAEYESICFEDDLPVSPEDDK